MILRVLRKLGWALAVVWATTTLAFFINGVLPSDPARMVAGPQARPKDVEAIRKQLGLDRPIAERYGAFMSRLVHTGPSSIPPKDPKHGTCAALGPLHLDLGKSYQQRRPVVTILAERLPRTVYLAIVAVLLQAILGTIGGMIAARKKGKWIDHLTVSSSLLGISVPTFILGLLLQFVLAHELAILPLDGFGKTTWEHAVSVILPGLTLGIYGASFYTRIVRDELLGIIKQDHVRTARAKGASLLRVWMAHGLRNALVPITTLIGLDFGTLIGGAIVTETLFRWPGLGSLSVTALVDRDGPVIIGTVIITSTAIVLSNVAVDISYSLLDPRTRK